MSRSALSAIARSTNSDGSKLTKIAAFGSRQAPALSRCSVRVSVSTCSRSPAGMRLKKVLGRQALAVAERPDQPFEGGDRHLAAVEGEDRLERALERKDAPHAGRGAVVLSDDVGKTDAARHVRVAPFERAQLWHARFYRSLTDGGPARRFVVTAIPALAISRNLSTLRRAARATRAFPENDSHGLSCRRPFPREAFRDHRGHAESARAESEAAAT